VNAENLALNYSTNAEIVEDLSAVFPWVCITVLSDCFVVEAIDSGDLSSLVVTSEESDVSRVLELQTEKKLECFD